MSSARAIDNEDANSEILAGIATGLVELQSFRKARLVANGCKNSHDKLSAYTVILQAYYEMKNPVQQKEETAPADSTKMTNK